MITGLMLNIAFGLYASTRAAEGEIESANLTDQQNWLDRFILLNQSPDFEMVHSRPGRFDEERIALDFNYSAQGDYLGYEVSDYTITGLNERLYQHQGGILQEDVRYGHVTIGRYEYDPEQRRLNFTSDNADVTQRRLNEHEIRITVENADRYHSAAELRSGDLHGGAEYDERRNTISFTLDEGDIFGRDWRSGVVHDIDPRLFKLAERTLEILQSDYGSEAELMDLVSLYRSRETISQLGGATRSQHQFGRAIDMGPAGLGVSYADFHAASMQAINELKDELGFGGGIGTYSARNQVHFDTRGTSDCGLADWGLLDRLPRPSCAAA